MPCAVPAVPHLAVAREKLLTQGEWSMKRLTVLAIAAAMFTLVACGGGGGADSNANNAGVNNVAPAGNAVPPANNAAPAP